MRRYIGLRILIILVLIAFDVLATKMFYQENHHLPFTVPSFIEDEVATILPDFPRPSLTPAPLAQNVEVSSSQWVGSIVYGKLTNHNQVPIAYTAIQFSVNRSKDDLDIYKTYTATIAAKLAPDESIYFSQRFSGLPTGSFWWNATILQTQQYEGQSITAPPSGQKISAKPIATSAAPQSPHADTTPWGVAKQIDDVTWTIKVADDDRMATPQETFDALNAYRKTHGVGPLSWDDNLAAFANARASYLNTIRSTDKHKGFEDYTADTENVRKLGFSRLGENIGYGSKLIGVHLIEWIYAADEGHNKNQLNPQWSHVGIGISGLGVAFEFGGDKI